MQDESTAIELESPFNDYTLEEVSFLLRFMYRPADLNDLPGITRLANRCGRLRRLFFGVYIVCPSLSRWRKCCATSGQGLLRCCILCGWHSKVAHPMLVLWLLAASMPWCSWQPSTRSWQQKRFRTTTQWRGCSWPSSVGWTRPGQRGSGACAGSMPPVRVCASPLASSAGQSAVLAGCSWRCLHGSSGDAGRCAVHPAALSLLCRALAETFITLPEGLPLTYRAANGLGRLGRETIIAVVAAMAAALQRVDSHLLTQAASTIPDDAVLLAGRNEAALGSASLLWEVPQLAAVREKRESPAFGPATKSGSSASAPMFKLEVQGPTIEEAPYGFGFGNPPQGACLSATLAVTYKDEWPPGTALAAFIMVKLLGQVSQRYQPLGLGDSS